MLDHFQTSHNVDWDHPPWPYFSILLGVVAVMVCWRITLYHTHRSLQKRTFKSRFPLSSRERFFYHAVFAFQALQTKYFNRPAILRIAGCNIFGYLDYVEVFCTLTLYSANILLIIIPIHQGTVNTITGTLAEKVCLMSARCIIIHMPFLFATAGRCSVLSSLIGVSYRSMNSAHRAIGRMCIAAAIIHLTGALLFIKALGLPVTNFVVTNSFTRHSTVAFCCFLVSVTMSLAWVRTRKFQLFLVTHVIAAAIVLPMVYYHKAATVKWLVASAVIWGLDRMNRWTGIFLNHLLAPMTIRMNDHAKLGTITASIEYLEGALVLRIPMQFTWTPGQHIYISFWSKKMLSKPWHFGRWHPFTLINLPIDSPSQNKDESTVRSLGQGWMGCCVVQVRNGTTRWLSHNAGSQIQVLVDGPYGGHDMWSSAHSTLVLFAGGAGITYVLGVIEGLAIAARRNQVGNLQRVEIYWALKNEEQLKWVEPRLSEICTTLESFNLAVSAHAYSTKKPRTLSRVRVQSGNRPIPIALQLTPMGNADYLQMVRDTKMPLPPTANTRVSYIMKTSVFTLVTGRPNLDQVFSEICERSQGTILAHVCGPRSLSDAVKISAAKLCSPQGTWNGKLHKCIKIHHELFNTT